MGSLQGSEKLGGGTMVGSCQTRVPGFPLLPSLASCEAFHADAPTGNDFPNAVFACGQAWAGERSLRRWWGLTRYSPMARSMAYCQLHDVALR